MTVQKAEEQARQPRLRTLKQGFAGWTELHSVVECVVRDMSENGAKLQFKDVSTVPSDFELTIPVDGTIRPCKIIWSRGDFVGVEFTGPVRESKKHKRDQVLTAYRVDENTQVRREDPPPPPTPAPRQPEPQPIQPIARPKRPVFGKLGK